MDGIVVGVYRDSAQALPAPPWDYTYYPYSLYTTGTPTGNPSTYGPLPRSNPTIYRPTISL